MKKNGTMRHCKPKSTKITDISHLTNVNVSICSRMSFCGILAKSGQGMQ